MIQNVDPRAKMLGQVTKETTVTKKKIVINKYQTFSNSFLTRINEQKTLLPEERILKSQKLERKKTQPCQTMLMRKVSEIIYGEKCSKKTKTEIQENVEESKKTPEGKKYQREDLEQLASDFLLDWSKTMDNKKHLYMKLRGKLVRKFPSMKKYYSQTEITLEKEEPIQKSTIKKVTKNSFSNSRASSYRNSKTPSVSFIFNNKRILNLLKSAYFYSRSKKKCLKNIINVETPIKSDKNINIPRITYLNYKKDHDQKKKFKGLKIGGLNMMKKRDELLELEKEGSREYSTLKKCLQQAIDQCDRFK